MLLCSVLLFVGAGGGLWFSHSSRVTESSHDKSLRAVDRRHIQGAGTSNNSVAPSRPSALATERNALAASSEDRLSHGAIGTRPTSTRENVLLLPTGLCTNRDAAWERSRAQYLATFIDVNVAEQQTYNARLLVAPGTMPQVLLSVGRELHSLGMSIQESLGLHVEPATIYLYSTVKALRDHACVHPAATAYYDGAIHLAPPDPESPDQELWPRRAIRHEYTHHVLMASGVGEPFWFQEGVAMQVARDYPRADSFPVEPFAMGAMIDTLDHSDTTASVLQRYAQSFTTVGFLRAICRGTSIDERAMARALLDRIVEPGNLFNWAAQQCSRDLDESAARLWELYWKKGQLDDTTQQRVWQRATPPVP